MSRQDIPFGMIMFALIIGLSVGFCIGRFA